MAPAHAQGKGEARPIRECGLPLEGGARDEGRLLRAPLSRGGPPGDLPHHAVFRARIARRGPRAPRLRTLRDDGRRSGRDRWRASAGRRRGGDRAGNLGRCGRRVARLAAGPSVRPSRAPRGHAARAPRGGRARGRTHRRNRAHHRRGRLRGALRHHHRRVGTAAGTRAHGRREPPRRRTGPGRAACVSPGEGGQRAGAAPLSRFRLRGALHLLVPRAAGRAGMTEPEISHLARALGRACQRRRVWVATAESCTGGGVSEAITRIAGSSAWFERGFVTYTNVAKEDLLGVSRDTLKNNGAVSEDVAAEMAAGALARSPADVAVAVTGIAGPQGGTTEKPVGLVWFAWMHRGGAAQCRRFVFDGDREAVRRQSVAVALQGLIDLIG